MIKFLKSFGLWISFGLWFFLIVLIGYWGIKARQTANPALTDSDPAALYVNTNETLSAAKRNSLVDTAYYPKYAFKDEAAVGYSTASLSYVSDTAMNTTLNVKKWDLVLVVLNGSMENSSASNSTRVKINLVSGDGTWIDTPAEALAWLAHRHPFSLMSLIKVNSDTTLVVNYQGKVNGGTWSYWSAKIKLIVIWKSN